MRQPDQSARKMLQSVSLDSDHPIDAPDIMRRRVTRTNQSVALIDIRIIVVWLECFEDCDKFPIGNNLDIITCLYNMCICLRMRYVYIFRNKCVKFALCVLTIQFNYYLLQYVY